MNRNLTFALFLFYAGVSDAQVCTGALKTISATGIYRSQNSCRLHPEIVGLCGGAIRVLGGGTSVYEVPINEGHGDVQFQVIGGSFDPIMVLERPGGCNAESGCVFSEVSSSHPSPVGILPAADPSGMYHLFVTADVSSHATCGAFTLVVTGDMGSPADQTISFTSTPPTSPHDGESYTVTATASSGLPVNLDIGEHSSSGCTISGHSSGAVVSYSAPGACIIQATQSGSAFYNAAPVETQQLDVVPAAPKTLAIQPKQPSNGVAGSPLVGLLDVREYDEFGYQVITDNSSIISFVANGPGALRGEPVTATVKFGSAIFDGNLILDKAGRYTLTASSNLPGVSSAMTNEFDVVPSSGAQLRFLSPIDTTVQQGDKLADVLVGEFDEFGNVVSADNSTTVKLSIDSCGGLDIASGPLTAGQILFHPGVVFRSKSASVRLMATSTTSSAPSPASSDFAVVASDDFVFFGGYEECVL